MHEIQKPHAVPVRRRFVPNAPYRVAHDLSGDWWIWKRSSANAWTTFQRCGSEAEAQLICEELNAGGRIDRPGGASSSAVD